MRKEHDVRNDLFSDYDYRSKSNDELITIITNKENPVNKIDDNPLSFEEHSFKEVLLNTTESKRRLIIAGIELYNRYNLSQNDKPKLVNSVDAYEFIKSSMIDSDVEECWVIFLSRGARVIKKRRFFIGGYTDCVIDVRIIFKEAILCNASAIIICHNHPSGNNHPSNIDDTFTDCAVKASKLLNIKILDHIIVCKNSFYSYSDEGKINK